MTIGHNATVHGCIVEDAVLIGMGVTVMNDCRIGEGSIIEGAIVDKNVRIGRRTRIVNDHGWEESADSDRFTVRDGVAVVPKDAMVPDGWQPEPGLKGQAGSAKS